MGAQKRSRNSEKIPPKGYGWPSYDVEDSDVDGHADKVHAASDPIIGPLPGCTGLLEGPEVYSSWLMEFTEDIGYIGVQDMTRDKPPWFLSLL